jgi:hypothetical protein
VIPALWARFYGWILGTAAVLAAVAGVYLKGRSAGKQVEQQKATQRELADERARANTIQEANDVSAEVNRMPADAVRDRLRDQWTRD